MNVGEILIYLNPLLVLCSIYFGFNYLKNTDKADKQNFEALLSITLVTHTIALILLAYYFLVTDLRFEYVSDYSAENLSLRYKLAGIWAGRDGTLLIWAWTTILSINVERKLHSGEDSQKQSTSLIGCIILLGFCIIQLYINPFSQNETVPGIGNGLNPLLLSPYMIIHPPIVFVSYGMIVLLYASGMAYLITGNKNWNETVKRWGRSSWIGMSLALAIGGYWAYVTLGWGGYWAWDPVETAGLLPWLATTSLLHTSVMSRRKKKYSVLGPLLAMLTFVLVLLESFVTRGGIWSSVHAFIVEETGSAWNRLGYVLENDVSVKGFFILMILSIILTFGLVVSNYRKKEAEEPKEYNSLEDYFSEDNTFFAAIYTQLLILTVTLVLLLVRANGYMTPEVFEVRLAPFVVILSAIFTIHTLRPFIDLQKILVVVGLGIAFSLAYAIMSEGRGWMVGAMIPWAFICGYSIFRYMWRYRTKKLLPMLRAWGPYTAHLGMMLILIGYCLSYGLGTEDSITLQEGERKLAGNFVLELEKVTMDPGPDEMKVTAFIRLIENDDDVVIDDQISKRIEGTEETTQIYLKHQIHRDLYITLNSATPGAEGGESSATITVREIPGIILVWTGTLLTISGMLLTMFTEWKPGKEWLRSIGK
ncbi:MAG: cytochrome c biogenesis protein CcsA [Candidatus Poseidoniia archaeon]|jgi:cytochrome c-type biogenesis protein CcmF|nr:cytochrome c biogenesis protein CcsA [Candidatus Poseidoniia archaeon]MDP6441447.1 cytochrome c biogenesis protein CcsA [Candidatus Poseidoniia archaeon]MDP7188100.1 cytochrome c biogenesis protein CcsA [Candidatus Poseidoniia archaeon]MDP7444835.1 cytochrome c biogenesis protein CcsA [Candidatus Poseidoniia archaeon]MDP7665866.1 cytochrome c biogenesis protein CcsA [Candidatus Poseidoniia archaeon]|tara:strand:- start:2566 stop:4509 length:1944 start_codon:yes stop_codon:yes gene_type:complete